jgi:hypothetical protein
MHKITFVRLITLSVLLLFLPSALAAQSKKRTSRKPTHVVVRSVARDQCCRANRWLFEPYAGAFRDAYDISPDDENTAPLFGLRVGYMLGSRTRLLGNVGYSRTDDVSNPQGTTSYFLYDNTWVFTTGGAEFDVVPGRTSASIGVQAGAAWRRVDLDGRVGLPPGLPDDDRGFSSQEVVVPSVILRHRLLTRATLTAGLHDYIFDVLEGPAQHGLAVTVGLAFR